MKVVKAQTAPHRHFQRLRKACRSLRKLVGARGFEPRTSWSRTKRATRLRYAPARTAGNTDEWTTPALRAWLVTVHSSLSNVLMVGTAGFEPATTCTPSKCATRLRYVPARTGVGFRGPGFGRTMSSPLGLPMPDTDKLNFHANTCVKVLSRYSLVRPGWLSVACHLGCRGTSPSFPPTPWNSRPVVCERPR